MLVSGLKTLFGVRVRVQFVRVRVRVHCWVARCGCLSFFQVLSFLGPRFGTYQAEGPRQITFSPSPGPKRQMARLRVFAPLQAGRIKGAYLKGADSKNAYVVVDSAPDVQPALFIRREEACVFWFIPLVV